MKPILSMILLGFSLAAQAQTPPRDCEMDVGIRAFSGSVGLTGSQVLSAYTTPPLTPPRDEPACEERKTQGANGTDGMGYVSFSGDSSYDLKDKDYTGVQFKLELQNVDQLPLGHGIALAEIATDDEDTVSVFLVNTEEGVKLSVYTYSGHSFTSSHAAQADVFSGTGTVYVNASWNYPLMFGRYRQMSIFVGGHAAQTHGEFWLRTMGEFTRVDRYSSGSLTPTPALQQDTPNTFIKVKAKWLR
jgi:hypothetical protein